MHAMLPLVTWKQQVRHWLVCLLLIGSLLAFSGCGFQAAQGEVSNELDGMVALSVSNVWAVGFATAGQGVRPLIEHWDGRTWAVVPAPSEGDHSFLSSVAARSARDVWAVGAFYRGAAEETLIEHWDGHSWKTVASPNSQGDNELRGVAVVSATDAWAVGSTTPCPPSHAQVGSWQGSALVLARPIGSPSRCTEPPYPPPQPLIEHWDGRAWSIASSPLPDPNATDQELRGVVAFATDDVWASGSVFDRDVTSPDGATLIEHWDGKAWHIMTDFDTALGSGTALLALLSSNDIWSVEDPPPHKGIYPPPTIQHWDGSAWSVVAGPQQVSASNYGIEALAASGPEDVWAIGGYYYSSSLPAPKDHVFTMHWNGSVWLQVLCPSGEGAGGNITASVSLSPTDAWIVGAYPDSSGAQLTFMEHWDGRTWSLVPNPNPGTPAPAEQ